MNWLATRDHRAAHAYKNQQRQRKKHQRKPTVEESINLGVPAAGPIWQERKWNQMYGHGSGDVSSLIPKDFGVSSNADVKEAAT